MSSNDYLFSNDFCSMPTFCFLELQGWLAKMVYYYFLSKLQLSFISTNFFLNFVINWIKITIITKIAQCHSFYYLFHSFKFTLSIILTVLIFIFILQTMLFVIYFVFEVIVIIKVSIIAALAHKAVFPAATLGNHFTKSEYFHLTN